MSEAPEEGLRSRAGSRRKTARPRPEGGERQNALDFLTNISLTGGDAAQEPNAQSEPKLVEEKHKVPRDHNQSARANGMGDIRRGHGRFVSTREKASHAISINANAPVSSGGAGGGLRQASESVPTGSGAVGVGAAGGKSVTVTKSGKGGRGGHHSSKGNSYHSAQQFKRKRKESSAVVPIASAEGSASTRLNSRRPSPADPEIQEGIPGTPSSWGSLKVSSLGTGASKRGNSVPDTTKPSLAVSGLNLPLRSHAPRCNYVYYTTSSNRYPVSICSIVPYRRKQPSSARAKPLKRPPTAPERNVASKAGKVVTKAVGKISTKSTKKPTVGKSYHSLLHPHSIHYDPTWLDDPRLTSGKLSTIMNLPGMRVSLFPYVRSSALRQELNGRFMQTHPNCTITLTKIRSIKKRMLLCGTHAHLDLAVIAMAYVCMEKLIIYGFVTKETRKCDAAVCLLLATKFYHYSTAKLAVMQLLEVMEKYLGTSPRDVMAREMLVYTRLKFDISARPEDIRPHYVQLQNQIRSTTDSVLMEYRHFAVHDFDLLASEQHGSFATSEPGSASAN